MCNSNLFGDIFFVCETGEPGGGDRRPMAGQEGNCYCVFDASQRGPPLGQDFDGSQRMVRRLAGTQSGISFCARRNPSVNNDLSRSIVWRQGNDRTPTDFVDGPTRTQ